MKFSRLIPELTVTDIERSKRFYVDLIGFKIEYERQADQFVFLSLDDAQVMLEGYHEDGWNTAEMHYPFGRGINFSVEVDDIESIYSNIEQAGYAVYRPLMVNAYESDGEMIVQREFLIQDPDGYLLRLTQEQRSAAFVND